MISLVAILSIVCLHFVADFVLQTHEQAVGKSKDVWYLLEHTLVYSACWLPVGVFFFSIGKVLLFVLITFICHTVTDYFTSRFNAKLWEKGNVHNFFVGIGFDQVLHYAQLFTTYYLLTKV